MPEGTLPRRPTGSNAPWRTNAVPIDDGLDGADQGVPPPAYGEHHDQVQISQAGFAADAAVTGEAAKSPVGALPHARMPMTNSIGQITAV
jgi:hypothetical protein